jgi:integrase
LSDFLASAQRGIVAVGSGCTIRSPTQSKEEQTRHPIHSASDPLAIRKDNLDLESGTFITRAADNKGKRDEILRLHPIVVEHLRKIVGDHPLIFRCIDDDTTLWSEFARIQRGAGIERVCPENHRHTPVCHAYSFHDFRRAFATINAPRMKPEALQGLMRHKSHQTTLCYVNLANQVEEAVLWMPVPEVLK